jgi:MoaA/NifB/PqqE/SkfB family radical SAM enzyme
MTDADWRRVIDQAASVGVGAVQFIGGEPTLHPGLAGLIDHTRAAGIQVEVFSNLVHVPAALWDVFARPGVSLACSYYSDDSEEHAAVTGRAGSRQRTRANIAEAVRRSVPFRVGVIDLGGGQRVEQAVTELTAMGVTQVSSDRVRGVGRGSAAGPGRAEELCGRCATDVLAVSADGSVWPCVFSRWLPVGNVLESSLPEILSGARLLGVRRELADQFAGVGVCVPDMCNPQCGPSCSPACKPAMNCKPVGACAPWYR